MSEPRKRTNPFDELMRKKLKTEHSFRCYFPKCNKKFPSMTRVRRHFNLQHPGDFNSESVFVGKEMKF